MRKQIERIDDFRIETLHYHFRIFRFRVFENIVQQRNASYAIRIAFLVKPV
jgi:hypothetical protein